MFNIHTMSCSDADYQPGTPESWSSGTIGSDDDIELLLLGQPRKPTPYEIDREEYERTHLAPMLQQMATIDNCDSDPGYLDASRFSDDDSEDAEAAAADAAPFTASDASDAAARIARLDDLLAALDTQHTLLDALRASRRAAGSSGASAGSTAAGGLSSRDPCSNDSTTRDDSASARAAQGNNAAGSSPGSSAGSSSSSALEDSIDAAAAEVHRLTDAMGEEMSQLHRLHARQTRGLSGSSTAQQQQQQEEEGLPDIGSWLEQFIARWSAQQATIFRAALANPEASCPRLCECRTREEREARIKAKMLRCYCECCQQAFKAAVAAATFTDEQGVRWPICGTCRQRLEAEGRAWCSSCHEHFPVDVFTPDEDGQRRRKCDRCWERAHPLQAGC